MLNVSYSLINVSSYCLFLVITVYEILDVSECIEIFYFKELIGHVSSIGSIDSI